MDGPVTMRACPFCYRVVRRLHEIRITLGLELRDPVYRCDLCISDLEDRAAADPAIIVERTGRILAGA